jgi:hypothetical protein
LIEALASTTSDPRSCGSEDGNREPRKSFHPQITLINADFICRKKAQSTQKISTVITHAD